MEANKTINPLTGHQWDINSLVEKLLEHKDALLQAQEKNITLAAQLRELERQVKDAEDLRSEHDNQSQLLADKMRENKYIHQELSRMSSLMSVRLQENEELKSTIADLQAQLKNSQADRDLLAIMLTEMENSARDGSRMNIPPRSSKENPKDWKNILEGK